MILRPINFDFPWKRLFIWILMLLFALVVMPITFLLSFYNTFLDKTFYTKDLASFAYNFVTEKLPNNDQLNNTDFIRVEDLKQVFKKVYTEKDFSDFFNVAYSAVERDLSNVKDGQLSLHIPMDIFKGKQEAIVSEMSDILYARIPACADKVQPKDFECIPKGLAKPDFTSKLRAGMDMGMFSKLPNTFDIIAPIPKYLGQNVWGFVNGIFYWILIGGFSFALLLLVFISLLVASPWQLVLKAASRAFLLPSFLLLIFAAALYFFPHLFNSQTPNPNADVVFLLAFFFNAFSLKLLLYVLPVFILATVGMIYGSISSIKKSYES